MLLENLDNEGKKEDGSVHPGLIEIYLPHVKMFSVVFVLTSSGVEFFALFQQHTQQK